MRALAVDPLSVSKKYIPYLRPTVDYVMHYRFKWRDPFGLPAYMNLGPILDMSQTIGRDAAMIVKPTRYGWYGNDAFPFFHVSHAVPEPGGIALLGAAGMILLCRRKR